MPVKVKRVYIILVLVGYLLGLVFGYSYLKGQYMTKYYCTSTDGSSNYDPYESNQDTTCLKWSPKVESREKEAFYTYGLLGAFIGGWVGVMFVTFFLKK
jgi:hypothetical protein